MNLRLRTPAGVVGVALADAGKPDLLAALPPIGSSARNAWRRLRRTRTSWNTAAPDVRPYSIPARNGWTDLEDEIHASAFLRSQRTIEEDGGG